MNVVLTQLQRKFEVPKDVFTIIVQLVRPRAPLPQLEKWDRWVTNYMPYRYWYAWDYNFMLGTLVYTPTKERHCIQCLESDVVYQLCDDCDTLIYNKLV